MDIQPMFRCAVGIDIHLALICVCIIVAEPGLEPVVHRREFGGFQRDRRAMADWIASFTPDIVVMESTGIYWKSPYAALEKVGIRAQVVNARQVKKVPGRKTDTSDAEWLAMLARAGLLRGSFIPPERLHTLRQVSRHHQKLTAMRAMEKNRLVKVLSDAGIRISAVVSDPHGVAASAIIDCLLDGGTPEQALALAGRLQAPREALLAALQGELSADHLFVAKTIRHHLRALEAQLADLEHYLVDALQPHEAALELLMTIPGIDRLAAAKLLVEIGVDMAAFGNAGRLCKWAGVCPGNDESAGKRRRGDTAPGNRYVRALLCQIAWAAVRTTSQFKSRFQNLVSRRGTKRAIVAIGHKVLKTVFVLLSRQVPYHDSTVDYEALAVKRNAPRWIKQLRKFGYLPKMA
ncbi:MAG: IS110 family transposase [Thiobacillus sp.]|nr:IS110 family transposase [Thiobacillus sp.]